MLILNSYSAVNFGRALFPIFALALNLPEDFFDDKVKWASSACSNLLFTGIGNLRQTKHSAALMKFLHYPPQTGPIDERVLGIGAHTEYVFHRYSNPNAASLTSRYDSWEVRRNVVKLTIFFSLTLLFTVLHHTLAGARNSSSASPQS